MTSVPTTKPPKGMLPWMWQRPPYDAEQIEVWREGWTEVRTIVRHGDPAMNVAGLYWRMPESKPTPPKPNLRVVK